MGLPPHFPPGQSYPCPTSCPGVGCPLVLAPSHILHPHCPCCPATPGAAVWVHRANVLSSAPRVRENPNTSVSVGSRSECALFTRKQRASAADGGGEKPSLVRAPQPSRRAPATLRAILLAGLTMRQRDRLKTGRHSEFCQEKDGSKVVTRVLYCGLSHG